MLSDSERNTLRAIFSAIRADDFQEVADELIRAYESTNAKRNEKEFADTLKNSIIYHS